MKIERAEQSRTTALRNKIVSFCRGKKTVKVVAAEFDLSVRTASNHLDALVKSGRLARQWIWDLGGGKAGLPVTGRYFYKKV